MSLEELDDESTVDIYFQVEDVEMPYFLEEEVIINWMDDIASNEGFEIGELNIIFVSDEYLLDMNREHLDHDYYTDIITFDHTTGDVLFGDLFISVDRVQENAATAKVDYPTELYRVIAHGLLHLCGYGDKTDEESAIMRSKEEVCLSLL